MILLALGTRPEIVKMHSTILELRKSDFPVRILFTNQQVDLAQQTFRDLGLQPDYTLSNVTNDDPLKFIISAITEFGELVTKMSVTAIVVHGDTFTTLIGGLVGFLKKIPVVHVEAGLRTWDLSNPWPEEGIRRIIDSISSILIAPTKEDEENLRIGVGQFAKVLGNPGVDAALNYGRIVDAHERHAQNPRQIAVTLHRRESMGEIMSYLANEIHNFATDNAEKYRFVFFSHPNPKTLDSFKWLSKSGVVDFLAPASYTEFVSVLSKSWLCLTDSGGVLLESVTLGVPTALIRDSVEVNLDNTSAKLFGRSSGVIEKAMRYFEQTENYFRHARSSKIYGNGDSGARIAELIISSIKPID